MKNFKAILIILFMATFLNEVVAQDSTRTFIVAGVPQYVINRGLRLDFEKKLGNPRQWLVLSPQYYMGWIDGTRTNNNSQNPNPDGDSLFGFGLNVSHKIFLMERSKPIGGYFSYGIEFLHFNMGYKEYDWVEYTEDGQTLYDYRLTNFSDKINKIGLNAAIGVQGILVDYIVYDVYIGLGARYSFIDSGLPGYRDYKRNYWDYGYSGPLLLLGARLGVLLF